MMIIELKIVIIITAKKHLWESIVKNLNGFLKQLTINISWKYGHLVQQKCNACMTMGS